MEKTRKRAALMLSLIISFSTAAPAFAEGEETSEQFLWQTVFDAEEYNYNDAAALTTSISEIWTDWEVSGNGSAVYSHYGKPAVNGMSVRPVSSTEVLTITSPGFAAGADAFKIEFVMGCGANYFDTMVYDNDGNPIFSYDYGSNTDGFYPQVADRSFGENTPAYLKSDPTRDDSNPAHTTFKNDTSIMTITVENKTGLVDGTDHNGDYYVVTYNCDGNEFDKEYYSGRANGFKAISCFKNGNGADCVYAKLKISEYSETKYVAQWENEKFETLDDAIDAAGALWNSSGQYNKIELLDDAEITREHKKDNDYLRAYINGNGHTINVKDSNRSLETITLRNVTLTGGVTGVGNNLTEYPGVSGSEIAWDNVKLDNMQGDCLILNQGQIKDCLITNYSGVCIFPNNTNSASEGNLIQNTTITNTSVDSKFPAVRVYTDNHFVIDNSTITGTTTGGTATNDVTIVDGTLTIKGDTTIGLMNKAGTGSLILDNFSGKIDLDSSFGKEVGAEIATVTGTFSGTVTLNGLDEENELKVKDGKLVIAKKSAAPVNAVAVEVEPDAGQNKDAAGFTYAGLLEPNQTISSIIWYVTDSKDNKTAKIESSKENGLPAITGGNFTVGLLITGIPVDKVDDLSATVIVE